MKSTTNLFLLCLLIPLTPAAFFRRSVDLRSTTPIAGNLKQPTDNKTVEARAGLNFESCKNRADCIGGRNCYDVTTARLCGESFQLCVCIDPTQGECTSSAGCASGEICARLEYGGQSVDYCVARPVAERNKLDEVGACIDARLLNGMEKVYKNDAHTTVLCDSKGSCATGGHMVEWRGKGMMMRTYCQVVGCRERKMDVNSPKYKVGVRVRTMTNELVFTGFAARFGTRVEEGFMKIAIRAGL